MNTTSTTPDKDTLISSLREFFHGEQDVELVYLFGSVAEGRANAQSDIDIGIYLSEILSKTERFQRRIELISRLTTFLKNNSVDLLVINDTSPVLSFEIIKPNVLVLERDRGLKIDVEQRIMSRYLDRKHHEDLMNQILLERIMEKGLA
ncbi:nucleotidyltransferase domain-containing protein [Methanolobus sp. ZRKC3]|uniref:type VII toxin-antitoxin system MntA family adenylyltransferase antitoxin n=1 Tax=Methanolobus sp. ZRKC3 TaxID=3125786 RepID=UPI00324DC4CB